MGTTPTPCPCPTPTLPDQTYTPTPDPCGTPTPTPVLAEPKVGVSWKVVEAPEYYVDYWEQKGGLPEGEEPKEPGPIYVCLKKIQENIISDVQMQMDTSNVSNAFQYTFNKVDPFTYKIDFTLNEQAMVKIGQGKSYEEVGIKEPLAREDIENENGSTTIKLSFEDDLIVSCTYKDSTNTTQTTQGESGGSGPDAILSAISIKLKHGTKSGIDVSTEKGEEGEEPDTGEMYFSDLVPSSGEMLFYFNAGTLEDPLAVPNNIQHVISHSDEQAASCGWHVETAIYFKYSGSVAPVSIQGETRYIYDSDPAWEPPLEQGAEITPFGSNIQRTVYSNFTEARFELSEFNPDGPPYFDILVNNMNIIHTAFTESNYTVPEGYNAQTNPLILECGVLMGQSSHEFYINGTNFDTALSTKLSRCWFRLNITLQDNSVINTPWLGQSLQLVGEGSSKQDYPPGMPV